MSADFSYLRAADRAASRLPGPETPISLMTFILTEVRSQARLPCGSNGVHPPTDLDVVRSHRLCDPANQIRVGRCEEQNGLHLLGELRKERRRVFNGDARLLGGQNPILRWAEAEMVDTHLGQRQASWRCSAPKI